MIKKFTQGEESDAELFCLIGKWATDRAVHEVLGMPITSKSGDIWLIDVSKNVAAGFAQIRPLKNGKAHLRYLFSDSASVKLSLAKKATNMAEKSRSEIYTYDRNDADLWRSIGWVEMQDHAHGNFCKWARSFV